MRDGYRCDYCGLELKTVNGQWDLFTANHLFPRVKGGPDTLLNLVTANHDGNSLNHRAKNAVPTISEAIFYNLRHTFCTRLSWVAPDAVVQCAMRHSSSETKRIYQLGLVHQVREQLERVNEKSYEGTEPYSSVTMLLERKTSNQ